MIKVSETDGFIAGQGKISPPVDLFFTTVPSPLGQLTLAGDSESLSGLWLPGQKYFGGGMLEAAVRRDDLPVFLLTKGWLERYFQGERPSPDEVPLRPEGSPYRRSVWRLLLKVPYGQVTTYGRLAAALGGTSPRAVGGAVGHNPISIIIPCHRVVGGDGSLTGYAGGLAAKKTLLKLEGADIPARKDDLDDSSGVSGKDTRNLSPRL